MSVLSLLHLELSVAESHLSGGDGGRRIDIYRNLVEAQPGRSITPPFHPGPADGPWAVHQRGCLPGRLTPVPEPAICQLRSFLFYT